MVTLKCDVRTCTYNKENCCCKGDISVGGKMHVTVHRHAAIPLRKQRVISI